MRRVQGIGDLDAEIEHRFDLHRPTSDPMLQGHAIQELHDDEWTLIVLADLINCADVGVVQRGSCTSFTSESFECLWVMGDIFGQEFQSDEASQVRVFSFIDDTHPATAELVDDAVMRDGLSDQLIRITPWRKW